jgi:hypothetical protein
MSPFPYDSVTVNASTRPPADAATIAVDDPIALARLNVAAVERLLAAAIAAEIRLADARPSEEERAQAAGTVANVQARLTQRLGELQALEMAG